MRTSKREKKTVIHRPEVRSLKIQPRYRENSYRTVDVPKIRLYGNWLGKLGFCQGRREELLNFQNQSNYNQRYKCIIQF